MKKIILLLLFFTVFINLKAQIDVSAGMGLSFFSASDFNDYITSTQSTNLATFLSEVDFYGEGTYSLKKNFDLGLEYDYSIYSYSAPNSTGGLYEISFNQHKPTVVAYYVVPGEGYKFKFGGGIGVSYVTLTEKKYAESNYSAFGLGFMLKAQGSTLLSDNLYVNIAGDIRYDLPGELSDSNNNKISNPVAGGNLNLNSISFGLKLGVSYFF